MKSIVKKAVVIAVAAGALALAGCAHMHHQPTDGKMGVSKPHSFHHSNNTGYSNTNQGAA